MEERSVRHARGCFDVGACFYWDCVCITEDDEGFVEKFEGLGDGTFALLRQTRIRV